MFVFDLVLLRVHFWNLVFLQEIYEEDIAQPKGLLIFFVVYLKNNIGGSDIMLFFRFVESLHPVQGLIGFTLSVGVEAINLFLHSLYFEINVKT